MVKLGQVMKIEKDFIKRILEEEIEEIFGMLNEYVKLEQKIKSPFITEKKKKEIKIEMKRIKIKLYDKLERLYKITPPKLHEKIYYTIEKKVEEIICPRNPERKLLR